MMAPKKVSVIMPVYNVEEYLESCIQSILDQTHKNLEIILVNDGSTDTSRAICDHYVGLDSRVTVNHQVNMGVSSARNSGLDVASGEYVMFVDADDMIEPNMVEVLLTNALETGADIASCGIQPFSVHPDNLRSSTIGQRQELNSSDAISDMFYQKNVVNGPMGKLFKKELFNNTRFPEDVRIGEDLYTNYWLLRQASKITLVQFHPYHYRIHTGSAMRSNFSPDRMKILYLLDDIKNDIVQNVKTCERALMNRIFAETIFISLQAPNDRNHKVYRDICRKHMLKTRNVVITDKNSLPTYRLYAILTYTGWQNVINLITVKSKVGDFIKRRA